MSEKYKLYGSFWDGKPLPSEPPKVDLLYETDAGKMMLLSEIMKKEQLGTIENDNGLVLIDFMPNNRSKSIQEFYIIRLLQIGQWLKAQLVCNKKEDANQIRKMIDSYYKKRNIE